MTLSERDNTLDLVFAAARACARGWRQESFINELLSFEWIRSSWPIPNPNGYSIVLGESQLEWRSWVNLRKRLTAAGFVIMRQTDFDPLRIQVKMKHPALEEK